MSPANVEYIVKHNPELTSDKVGVAPNSVELRKCILSDKQLSTEKQYYRTKYNIPMDIPVFIYGGNLGKPQGIPFLIECLNTNANREDCFFIVHSNVRGTYAKNRENTLRALSPLLMACDAGSVMMPKADR